MGEVESRGARPGEELPFAAEPAEPSALRPGPSPLPLSRSGEGFTQPQALALFLGAFLAPAFLAVRFFAPALALGAGALAPPRVARRGFFDGPAARRALMSAIASSSVTASALSARGSVALTSPSVT